MLTALGPLGAEASQVDGEGRHLAIPTSAGASALVEAVRALDDADVAIADLALRRPVARRRVPGPDRAQSTADEEAEAAADGGRPAGRRAGEEQRMSTTTATVSSPAAAPSSPPCREARRWTDGLTIARRNLLRIVRTPQLVFFSTIQPIMFVLLFNYVFGGAIVPGGGTIHRLPDARDHRADRRVRRDPHRDRPGRGHGHRHHRPVPVPADGPLRRARRAYARRRRPQPVRRGPHGRRRHGRRFPVPQRRAAGGGRRSSWPSSSASPSPGSSPSSASRPATPRPRSWLASPSSSRWCSPAPPSCPSRACPAGCRRSPTTSP